MKLHQKLLACGLIGASTFLGCIKHRITPPWPVYNSKTGQFIERKWGINETMLNYLDISPLLFLGYRTEEALKNYQKAENKEQVYRFSPAYDKLERGSGTTSFNKTISTMAENLASIKAVDELENVKEKYKPLKELVTKCNKIYEETEEGIERVIKLHDTISEYIKPEYKANLNSMSIVDLVNGEVGDCNDKAPAYFALFNYYHVECDVIMGGAYKSFFNSGVHAWLRIKTKEHNFELDPTFYKDFVPLDIRNEEITYGYTVPDSSMKFRK